jgi:Flp pilus assembly protein TadB
MGRASAAPPRAGTTEPCRDSMRAMIRRNAGLRPHHTLTLVMTVAIAAVVAYVVLGWVVGLVAFLIKTAIVLCVVAVAVVLVLRWARRP